MNSQSQKNVAHNISPGLKTLLAYVLIGGNKKEQKMKDLWYK